MEFLSTFAAPSAVFVVFEARKVTSLSLTCLAYTMATFLLPHSFFDLRIIMFARSLFYTFFLRILFSLGTLVILLLLCFGPLFVSLFRSSVCSLLHFSILCNLQSLWLLSLIMSLSVLAFAQAARILNRTRNVLRKNLKIDLTWKKFPPNLIQVGKEH